MANQLNLPPNLPGNGNKNIVTAVFFQLLHRQNFKLKRLKMNKRGTNAILPSQHSLWSFFMASFVKCWAVTMKNYWSSWSESYEKPFSIFFTENKWPKSAKSLWLDQWPVISNTGLRRPISLDEEMKDAVWTLKKRRNKCSCFFSEELTMIRWI